MDESESEAAERRSLRCVWVAGGRALTEQEAAAAIVSEARLLLQEDLAQLGVQWDPVALNPAAPAAPALRCPDDSSSGSDSSSTLHLQPHDEQRDGDATQQNRDKFKAGANGDMSSSGNNSRGDLEQDKRERAAETETEQRRSEPEDGAVIENLEKIKPLQRPEKLEMLQELEKDDAEKNSIAGGQEPNGNTKEKSKQGGPHSQANVLPRNLTQELSEVLASPFSQPKALPQPSPTPLPPPRFRAPISRVEEPRSCCSPTSQGDGSSTLVASSVQARGLKHSRALSKVLNSIRTDKMPQADVPAAQTSPSDTAAGAPAAVSTPTNATQRNPNQSSSSPEAKRRRVDDSAKDDFSSPELFAENEKGENDQAEKKAEGQSFGDSFELDTQTEKLIGQRTSQCRNKNHQSGDRMVQTEDGGEEGAEEEEAAVVTLDLEKNPNVRKDCLSTPNDVCPRFNISLTDSQMELILDTSQQVSQVTAIFLK